MKPSSVPSVRGKTRNPIDAFLLAKLEKEGRGFAAEADRRTLARRLHLDLLGLPPSPQDVNAFVADNSTDAYEKLVDRLLKSPHFGERWGRHWLDLARFAESDGYENGRLRPDAWRFRDWVVASFNADQPFDAFTIEQLAGDLLPEATIEKKVAAGLHRHTLWNSAASADKEEFRTLAIKDRTDTTGAVWMGLTLGCAQCHSHKYDPVSQREYYRLYAFFNRTDDAEVPLSDGKARVSTLRLVQRTQPHPTLAVFDGADGNQPCLRRDRSVTPLQALTLLNDPVFVECHRALGKRLQGLDGSTAQRLKLGFELCLARPPSTAELSVLEELLATQQKLGAKDETVWLGVARTLLNLDEFITRE